MLQKGLNFLKNTGRGSIFSGQPLYISLPLLYTFSMEAKLAIPVQDLQFKDGPLDASPTHLPYPPSGDTRMQLAMPVQEPAFKDNPYDTPPKVEQYPLAGESQPPSVVPIPEVRFGRVVNSTSSMYLPYADGSGPKNTTSVPIPGPRFKESAFDPPSSAPPYSSMIDDLHAQFALFDRQDRTRQNALHPVRLEAGQNTPVNGESGRHAVPTEQRLSVLGAGLGAHLQEWSIPEAGDGTLVAVSI